MKTIQPIQAWYNGQEVEASVINATCTSDNLTDAASFQYQIFEVIQNPVPTPMPSYLQPVVQGYLYMSGADYQAWDSNDYAYDWVAQQLNLTITGEYIPPQPVPPTE